MSKRQELKNRQYTTCLSSLMNTCISLREERQAKKCNMELNKIILSNITNGWSKKVYVKGFDCEKITFKNL